MKRFRKIVRNSLKVLFSPVFMLPTLVPDCGKKGMLRREEVLGELEISIISTFIEYIGRVSKVVYE